MDVYLYLNMKKKIQAGCCFFLIIIAGCGNSGETEEMPEKDPPADISSLNTTTPNGVNIAYQISDSLVTIEWSNCFIKSQLPEKFPADAGKHFIPKYAWENHAFVCLTYETMEQGRGCYILPLNDFDHVKNYTGCLAFDVPNSLVAYISASKTLVVENVYSNQQITGNYSGNIDTAWFENSRLVYHRNGSKTGEISTKPLIIEVPEPDTEIELPAEEITGDLYGEMTYIDEQHNEMVNNMISLLDKSMEDSMVLFPFQSFDKVVYKYDDTAHTSERQEKPLNSSHIKDLRCIITNPLYFKQEQSPRLTAVDTIIFYKNKQKIAEIYLNRDHSQMGFHPENILSRYGLLTEKGQCLMQKVLENK